MHEVLKLMQNSTARGSLRPQERGMWKRLGTVEDVVNAVCFFASPLSSYISGTSLYVDGTEHLHGNRMSIVELFKNLS